MHACCAWFAGGSISGSATRGASSDSWMTRSASSCCSAAPTLPRQPRCKTGPRALDPDSCALTLHLDPPQRAHLMCTGRHVFLTAVGHAGHALRGNPQRGAQLMAGWQLAENQISSGSEAVFLGLSLVWWKLGRFLRTHRAKPRPAHCSRPRRRRRRRLRPGALTTTR